LGQARWRWILCLSRQAGSGVGAPACTEGEIEVSETVNRAAEVGAGAPPGQAPGEGPWAGLRRLGRAFVQQREATVFVVAVLLVIYFGFISSASSAHTFFTRGDFVNITQIMAPIAIIACGEVLLLICGEIDLSPGFVFLFAPYLMHYLVDFYGVPAIPAILIALLFGLVVGAINGFFTVTVGVPSFITTFATAFILSGLTLYTSHAQPSVPPASVHGWIQGWFGELAWSELVLAVVIVAIVHVLLTRTRWGLHTIATGGNQLGASEAGVNVARIKYGNFMITSLLGAFTGIMLAFQLNTIDPAAGGFQAMFYAVTAAVIGGTAMLGGSGTILGAFLGSIVLALLLDGFNLIGISANIILFIFGAAVLLAMVVNVQLARVRAAGRA
jgi:simple sugar transport system permease protein